MVLEARETKLQLVVLEEDGVLVAMQVNVAVARQVNDAVARQVIDEPDQQKTGLVATSA